MHSNNRSNYITTVLDFAARAVLRDRRAGHAAAKRHGAHARIEGLESRTLLSTSLSGNISTSTTLTAANSPYNLTGYVTVQGAGTLNIDPGVTLTSTSGFTLTVASGGKVVADTANFSCSTIFQGGSTGSVTNSSFPGGVTFDNSSVTLGNDAFTTNPSVYPDYLPNLLAAGDTFASGTSIQLQGEDLADSLQLPVINNVSSYNVAGYLYVDSGGTLTISSGVTLKSTGGYTLYVTSGGNLSADNVNFNCSTIFQSGSTGSVTNSSFPGAVEFDNSSVTLGNDTFTTNPLIYPDYLPKLLASGDTFASGTSIRLEGEDLADSLQLPVVNNVSSYNVAGYVYVESGGVLTVDSGVTLTSTGGYTLYVTSGGILSADNVNFNCSTIFQSGSTGSVTNSAFPGSIEFDNISVTLGNDTFTTNPLIYPDYLPKLLASGDTFASGTSIRLEGEDLTDSLQLPVVNNVSSYNVAGYVYVESGGALTVASGVTLTSTGGYTLYVTSGGNLSADNVHFNCTMNFQSGSTGSVTNSSFPGGVEFDNSSVTLGNDTFTTNPLIYPDYLPKLLASGDTFASGTSIQLEGEHLTDSLQLPVINNVSSYNVAGYLYVDSGGALTVASGVTLTSTGGYTLYVTSGGNLSADNVHSNCNMIFQGGSTGSVTNSSFPGGVEFDNSSVTLGNDTFTTNPLIYPDYLPKLLASGDTFASGTSIQLEGEHLTDSLQLPVINNVSSYNVAGYLYVDSGGVLTIASGVTLKSTGGYTLYVTSGGNLSAVGNTFNCDINLGSASTGVVDYDTFINANGLTIDGESAASIHYNDFSNTTATVIAQGSGGPINLQDNWWGTTVASVIATKVTDFADNSNLPVIDYSSPLSAKPVLPPILTSVSATDVTAPSSSEQVTVVYTDTAGGTINSGSIAAGNITVKSATGQTLTVTVMSKTASGNTMTVVYSAAAPSGTWKASDNGTGQVAVNVGSVTDSKGNSNMAASTTFTIAVVAPIIPTVVITPPSDITTAGGSNELVTVAYTGHSAPINSSTLASSNLTVTGPTSNTLVVTLVGTNISGNTDTAMYSIAAPGGTWQSTGNGTYNIVVNAGAVQDQLGNGNAIASTTFSVNIPVPVPPTVSITAPNVTTTGATSETVTVVYTGISAAINAATISASNLTVTAPDSSLLSVAVANTVPSGNVETVTYTVSAPGGSWQSTSNGTYTVAVPVDAVRDLNGNGNAATSKTFNVSVAASTAPTAFITAPNITAAGGATETITVLYSGTATINTSTIAATNLTVTGPGNVTLPVTLTGISGSGDSVTATYSAGAPGGSWQTTANGTYSAAVNADAVKDVNGKGNSASSKIFTVAIPVPPTAAIMTQPIAASGVSETVTVVYSSSFAAIDTTTIGASNISVTGPAGTLAVTVSSTAVGASSVTVTYSVTPPGGAWAFSDNGVYTVNAVAGAVLDVDGNASVANSSTFNVAVPAPPPAATITAPPVAAGGGSAQTITVVYSSVDAAINLTTIAGSNITVMTSGGAPLTVNVFNIVSNGDSVTVTYTVAPPGGTWTAADNGTYTVAINAGAVQDVNGVGNAAASTSFSVNATTDLVVTVSTSNEVANNGQSITFIAIVSTGSTGGSTPTGTVSFYNGGTLLGTAPVGSDGQAMLTAGAMPTGNYAITANYSGDSTYPAVYSALPLKQAVTPMLPVTSKVSGTLPKKVVAGQKVKINQTVTISNLSGALFTGPVTINIYLSTDSTMNSQAIQLQGPISKQIKLKNKGRTTVRITITGLPDTVTTGTYYIIIVLTGSGGATTTAAAPKPVAAQSPMIDLSGAIHAPMTDKIGKTVDATLDVTNNGNIEASGPLLIDISSSQDMMLADATQVMQLTKTINLKPGKSTKFEITGLALPPTAGTYYLIVQLDPNNTFNDLNLANNTFVSAAVTVA